MTATTKIELAPNQPFEVRARYVERIGDRDWFHLVTTSGWTTEGEPAIVGGKGPSRNNYRLVPASMYANYRGLMPYSLGTPGGDEFVAPGNYMGPSPPERHLIEADGMLVMRFNPRQVAEWIDEVTRLRLAHPGVSLDDDIAREWAQKVAPLRGSLFRGCVVLTSYSMPEAKNAKNRVHFDLRAPGAESDEVARLTALGATVLERHDSHTVMADPEGNEFCVEPRHGSLA